MPSVAVVAAERRARCVELVTQGLTYDEIAQQVGYRSRGSVSKAVHRALRDRTADAVDQLRALELERLDALQAALWDRALEGDVKAVDAVLRVIDRRVRLLGIDAHTDARDRSTSTVVDPSFWDTPQARNLVDAAGGR